MKDYFWGYLVGLIIFLFLCSFVSIGQVEVYYKNIDNSTSMMFFWSGLFFWTLFYIKSVFVLLIVQVVVYFFSDDYCPEIFFFRSSWIFVIFVVSLWLFLGENGCLERVFLFEHSRVFSNFFLRFRGNSFRNLFGFMIFAFWQILFFCLRPKEEKQKAEE